MDDDMLEQIKGELVMIRIVASMILGVLIGIIFTNL